MAAFVYEMVAAPPAAVAPPVGGADQALAAADQARVEARPVAVAPSAFRLTPAAARGARIVPEPCPAPRPGEILVCGRRGQGQRLRALPPPPGVKPHQDVGTDFAGGRIEPHMHEEAMPQGRVSKRFTIDFRLPF